MKYLLLTLSLLIALPSAQAGWCGMGAAQDSIEHAAGGDHDCCPSDSADEAVTEEPCEDGAHCAGCIITVAVAPLEFDPLTAQRPQAEFMMPLTMLVPSHTAPPYRPPIS